MFDIVYTLDIAIAIVIVYTVYTVFTMFTMFTVATVQKIPIKIQKGGFGDARGPF